MSLPSERDWRDDAACVDVEPELFFATTRNAIKEAKAICGECVVKAECLDDAYETNDQWAVRGGMSQRQRAKTRAAWRRDQEREFA